MKRYEMQVLLKAGLTQAKIAELAGVSERTVRLSSLHAVASTACLTLPSPGLRWPVQTLHTCRRRAAHRVEESSMNRAAIMDLLGQHRAELQRRFAAKHLALFGCAARDELRDDSDVDVLVEFEGPATFDGYFVLKDYLEELFGRRVDLVTEKGLKPRARRHVEKDLVRVA